MLFDMLYKIKMGIIHILIKIEEITTCHFLKSDIHAGSCIKLNFFSGHFIKVFL